MIAPRGFTLLELLTALAVFSMIAAMTYAVVTPAGETLDQLARFREATTRSYFIDRQLRQDIAYFCPSQDSRVTALRLQPDNRGGDAHDHLWLTVRELGRPGLILVHYMLDDTSGVLVRESASPWARSGVRAMRWEMGEVSSFEVQAMDSDGHWRSQWDSHLSGALPRALRVRWREPRGRREAVLPLFVHSLPDVRREGGMQ